MKSEIVLGVVSGTASVGSQTAKQLDYIANQMFALAGQNPKRFWRGLELTLGWDSESECYTLHMACQHVFPSTNEVGLCSRAFSIPENAHLQMATVGNSYIVRKSWTREA